VRLTYLWDLPLSGYSYFHPLVPGFRVCRQLGNYRPVKIETLRGNSFAGLDQVE
jgi:hypothetical protein